jgi:ketosteroid isomerase-like protein
MVSHANPGVESTQEERMSDERTIEEMVAALAVAGREPMTLVDQVAEYYADDVHVFHVPPMPNDGPTTREHIVDLYRGETEVWLAKIPDYHHENLEVWREGDVIHLTVDLVGTVPDGTAFRSPTCFFMTVRDGLIVEAGLQGDAEQSRPMMDLVVEAELDVPLIWDPSAM